MIKAILWDIDGTLLNFKEAEKYAIRKCFSLFQLGECSDDMLARYSKINDTYWKMLERNEITKREVLHNRFRDFFRTEGIPCTEIEGFNDAYQMHLGDHVFFNDNCYGLVKQLKDSVKQYAVTNGTFVAQERKLKNSGLDQIFDDVFISEQLGVEKPNREFFDHVREKIGSYEKDEIMIVGDSLTSDMQGGVNAGILCCWYNPDQSEKKLELDLAFEIQNLWQVEDILRADSTER